MRYAKSHWSQSARGDEIATGYGGLFNVVSLAMVVRAEHFQGCRVIAGVRPAVQHAVVLARPSVAPPADSGYVCTVIEEFADLYHDRFRSGSSQVSAPGRTNT